MKKSIFPITIFLSWVLLLFFIVPQNIFAQGWQRTFDSMGQYEGGTGTPTRDGGYVSVGANLIGPGGLGLLKTDANGEQLWYQSFPDYTYAGNGWEILEEADGRLVITGDINSFIGNNYAVTYLLITDSEGTPIIHQTYDHPYWRANGLDRSHDNGYIIVGSGRESSGGANNRFPGFIMLVDSAGNELESKTYGGDQRTRFYDVKQTADGGYIITGNKSNGIYTLKVDKNLEEIWSVNSTSGWATSVIEAQPGAFYVCGQLNVNNEWGAGVIRFDNDGNEVFSRLLKGTDFNLSFDIELSGDGGLIYTGPTSGNFQNTGSFVAKTDLAGNLLWDRIFVLSNYASGYEIDRCINNDGYIMVGGYDTSGNQDWNLFVNKLDRNGNSYSNFLDGQLFNDLNLNCTKQSGETGYKKWIVKAEGNETFFAITRDSGYYSINLPPDDYTVSYSSLSPYLQTCQQDYDVAITNAMDTFFLDLPTVTIAECPFLTVDISTPRLRRCRENIYVVSYCNYGPAIAEDAYVEVLLDEYTQYLSSSATLIAQNNQLLTFEVGDVGIFDCGGFVIRTSLDCDSTFTGQTHCVAAHIYPDTLCLPIEWTGPIIEVEGTCTPDSINFLIKNVGGNMSASHDYIVIEDNIIMRSGDFNLPAGGTKRVDLPNQGGSVYHIEAEQDPNLPIYIDDSLATFTLNGCSEINMISEFFNWFANNDQSPFISIDCEQSIASFDPNDKRAYPKGFGDEHLIAANTEIEYKINFQNTGTDTAFRVVLEDVISPFLRPESIMLGASSHSYEFQISKGGQVSFVFDNILLPDSSTNEAASMGFVKFKIQQQPDNPIGTKIWNEAAIYFDFNSPIITNKTLHTIGEDFLLTVSTPVMNPGMTTYVEVYPNPFHNQATFEIKGKESQAFTLLIFDIAGHLIQSHSFNTHQFELQRNQLVPGIYIYEIRGNDTSLGRGKIIAH